jgi:hypothetical protein
MGMSPPFRGAGGTIPGPVPGGLSVIGIAPQRVLPNLARETVILRVLPNLGGRDERCHPEGAHTRNQK